MNLQKFDCFSPRVPGREPRVTFSKTGAAFFNVPASNLLKLSKNDRVEFYEDKDAPGAWFFTVLDEVSKAGNALRENNRQFALTNRALCQTVAGVGKTRKMRIDPKPVMYQKQFYYALKPLELETPESKL